jgi:hypothetical protein
VRVELLYFDGCPNHEALLPRLRKIVASKGISADVELRRIADEDTARRERFLGSPTVRVDGRDIEPDAERRTDYGMKCRLYPGAVGLSGQPDEEWVRAALSRGMSPRRYTLVERSAAWRRAAHAADPTVESGQSNWH